MSSKRQIYTAELISAQTHTEQIREYEFKLKEPALFAFKAGQFLMLHLPPENPGEKEILRAYSLASGEKDFTHFRLLIKYVEQGIASKFFWGLTSGQDIRFTGPFGKLFFPETPSKNLFFLSTGSGLAPHLSYIETYLEKWPQSRFHFLIGVRTQKDFFYVNYLENQKKRYPHFNYEFVLSRPDEQWKGRSGYLQKQISTLNTNLQESHFFICGNESMAKETKQALIEAQVPKEKILVEIF